MVKENATWIMWYSPDDFNDFYYFAYRIEGDTTINTVDFKKVYYYELQPNEKDPFIITDRRLGGVLMEDVEERKVYGRPYYCYQTGSICNTSCIDYFFLPEEEILLFDFNKTVGDTLRDCSLHEDDLDTEILKDSVKFKFGTERRTLENINGLELMEGVGYDDGLFMEAHSWVHAGWGFGLVNYCESSNMDCALITSVKEALRESEVKVFPNPSSDVIHIESTYKIDNIELVNIVGERLYSTESNKIELGTNITSGMYFVKINFKDGNSIYKKVKITSK